MSTSTIAPPSSANRPSDVSSGRARSTPGFRLLEDWRAATLDDGIRELARAQLNGEYQAAIAQATQEVGRRLDDRELMGVLSTVDRRLLPAAEAKVRAKVSQDAKALEHIFNSTVDGLRQRAPQLRNPFTPLAEGDAHARARETMVFENREVMVLVDRFCPSPKVLVVPKVKALTPLDVAPNVMTELTRAATAASDTFQAIAQSRPSDVWINPPTFVTLGQLHVHVQPQLPDFAEQLTPAEAGDEQVAERRLAVLAMDFWKKFTVEFQSRMKP